MNGNTQWGLTLQSNLLYRFHSIHRFSKYMEKEMLTTESMDIMLVKYQLLFISKKVQNNG